jgi:hypothetical protein
VPAGLETLILHCLAKDPNARPTSARELELALQAADAGDWNQELARQWWAASGLTTQHPATPDQAESVTPDVLETAAAEAGVTYPSRRSSSSP